MAKQWTVMTVGVFMFVCSDVIRAEGLQGSWGPASSQQFGFITELPETRPVELIHSVYALRSDLAVRRQVLEEKAAAMAMNPAEIVLAIAVPGGTLYAARKLQLQLRRKGQLERLNTEISELDSDLQQLALIVGTDGILVARAER